MKLLSSQDIDFDEVIKACDIRLGKISASGALKGLVLLCPKGHYHILVNRNMSPLAQLKTFLHEINHIKADMPKYNYFIGLNYRRMEIEANADMFARAVANEMMLKHA